MPATLHVLAYIAIELIAQQLLDKVQPPLEVCVVVIHGVWKSWGVGRRAWCEITSIQTTTEKTMTHAKPG